MDPTEHAALAHRQIARQDMHDIDETGIANPLAQFLAQVASASGALHVSLDVDYPDPSIAPAVGANVPSGATVRKAHRVMEMLHNSGLMTSLDFVEFKPFLDECGKTALLMVDLATCAFGR